MVPDVEPLSPTVANRTGRRLRIGIDLDGVVYDFQAAFRAWVAFRLGRAAHTLPIVTRWAFHHDWGLSADQFEELLDEGIRHGRLFAVGDPIPGAIDALRQVATAHDLIVITHRNRFGLGAVAEKATRHWLAKHAVPFTELHLTGAKGQIPVDLHLDDSPDVLTALHDQGIRAVAFDQPWNEHINHVERVHGWAGFLAFIDTIAPTPYDLSPTT